MKADMKTEKPFAGKKKHPRKAVESREPEEVRENQGLGGILGDNLKLLEWG